MKENKFHQDIYEGHLDREIPWPLPVPCSRWLQKTESLTKYGSNQSCRELKMKSCAWLPCLTIMNFCTCAPKKPAHFTLFIWNFPSFLLVPATVGLHTIRVAGSCLCCWQAKAKDLLCVISWTLGVALQITKGDARFLGSCHVHISFFNFL